jgi:hypothetical protein
MPFIRPALLARVAEWTPHPGCGHVDWFVPSQRRQYSDGRSIVVTCGRPRCRMNTVTGRNQTGHERAELSGHPNLRKSSTNSEHFVSMINSINELRVDHENKMFTYAKSGGTLTLPTTGRFKCPMT